MAQTEGVRVSNEVEDENHSLRRGSKELAKATQDRRTAYGILGKYQRLCTSRGGRKLPHQICCDESQSSPGGAREMSTLPFSFIVAPSLETSTPAA